MHQSTEFLFCSNANRKLYCERCSLKLKRGYCLTECYCTNCCFLFYPISFPWTCNFGKVSKFISTCNCSGLQLFCSVNVHIETGFSFEAVIWTGFKIYLDLFQVIIFKQKWKILRLTGKFDSCKYRNGKTQPKFKLVW